MQISASSSAQSHVWDSFFALSLVNWQKKKNLKNLYLKPGGRKSVSPAAALQVLQVFDIILSVKLPINTLTVFFPSLTQT